MRMQFRIGELYNNGELSFKEKDEMIRQSFRHYSGQREPGKNTLYEKESIKMQATKCVMLLL